MSRKSLLLVKLVCLILLLLLVVGIAVRVFWGGYQSMRFNWDETLEMSESFSGVRSVEVRTVSYAISVVEQPGSETKVEYYSSGLGSAPEPKMRLENGVLIVEER